MKKWRNLLIVFYLIFSLSSIYCDEADVYFQMEGYALTAIFNIPGRHPVKNIIIIPNDVKIIGIGAFRNWSGIEEIILPDGLIFIEDGAFANCRALKKVNIPNTVIKIGNDAFLDCINLTEIDFPESLIDIGADAFTGTGIKNLPVYESHEYSGFTIRGSTLVKYVNNGNKRVVVPEGIKIIGRLAFGRDNVIEEIVLPNGLILIERAAFRICKNLKNINIPDSTIMIGSIAFQDCINLKNIIFPENLIYIGDAAFIDTGLENVVLPKNIINVSHSTFRGCENLISVSMPDGVKSIGETAFAKCYNLEVINIPGDCVIGDMAFVDSDRIRRQNFPQWQNEREEFRIFEFHDNR